MRFFAKHTIAFACAAALCALLAACGGGGGGNGLTGGGGSGGNGLTPFPTASSDDLPDGARIDVASKNLFQMSAGDTWQYSVLNAAGDVAGAATRQVTADDGSGHVTLVDNDNGFSSTDYTVSSDGLFDPQPLGSAPASATSIVGGLFEYATPLYPVGAVRKHVRSGPWGEDLDGDGVGESFRFEYDQTFLGFETAQFSSFFTLKDVAHFHNVFTVTLRPTASGTGDYTITSTEDAWFAPGLGLVKAQRTTVDSDGATLDPPHTLLFSTGTIAGVSYNVALPPPPPLDGSFVDVALLHNALVYDSVRSVYYASIPGSVIGNGNSIATIDPVTAQVSYSAPVGSEPTALAIAADASVLYVGINGSSDVVRLALPQMTEQGRVHLPVAARALAVSPADPAVAAVTLGSTIGVALLRDMALQPKTASASSFYGNNLLAFDSTGTVLYGLNNETSDFPLRRFTVLADGLADGLVINALTGFDTRALSVSAGRVIAGSALYDASTLNMLGFVSTPSDCAPRRADALLVCLGATNLVANQATLLLADPGTFVIGSSLLFARSEPSVAPRQLIEGPAGQVAIDYQPATIRLFTSPKLLTPPTPTLPAATATASSTPDGQVLDVGFVYNSFVYDSARNVYYASIPASVIGAGNSIATIDPASGQVTYSAPVGSEPNALALAADGSVLYVGLNGSGEVERLALPSLAPQGRTRIPPPVFGFSFSVQIAALAVSPADAKVAAVFTGGGGTALLRDMTLQPNQISTARSNTLLTFDTPGTTLYGVDRGSGILDKMQVLVDGLADQQTASAGTPTLNTLSFKNDLIIAGRNVINAPALTPAGLISGAATDCIPQRGSGTLLLCLSNAFAQVQILVADSGTFVIGKSLSGGTDQSASASRMIQGPAGQVAFSYSAAFAQTQSTLRLFSSAQLP